MKRRRTIKGFSDGFSDSSIPPVAPDQASSSLPRTLSRKHGLPGEPAYINFNPDDDVLYHLSSLLDSVKTGIISLDGEGRVQVFNAVAEALFGVPRQAVLGRPFSSMGRTISFLDNALRALWERLADAVWAAGAALDLEYDLSRPKGHKRVISYSVYPLGRLAWSVGNGVVIMFEDITRRKELEDQILDGRKRLQTVFDGITDGIQVVDTQYRVTAVNKSMTSLIGGPAVIGERCYTNCSSGEGICKGCPALATFQSGQPASLIRKVPRKNATADDTAERILEITTFPLLDRASRVPQVVEYIKDVTEKIRLQERLEHARRLAALGEMAAKIAHEVRNPLNAITGAAHFLATEYPGDETIQKFTSLIKRQSHRVDQVASDILHAARPLRLNLTSVSVDTVVEQALASLRDMPDRQRIVIERTAGAIIPRVQVDELQIEQAVYNVLKNAVEAMPDGGRLRIGTSWEEETGRITVRIQDSGSGIKPADRNRVFQAFYTTKDSGTGLGLSIVEGVLKNHGGTIEIEQPDGGGTIVTLRIPARSVGKDGSPPQRTAPEGEGSGREEFGRNGNPGMKS
ncbi:MAG: ATP-binding protein [Nitrospiraceae bacterium]|nr:ATP-binding protein [Nitrospiraceae bacterium]